ncbi:MAG TPA: PAS domain S-box protein [Anaerolineales bacterium]|nr:PAS domain S-box protein [Anaerolineales bacterium]HNN12181.1 PAS domain S-box protein [Anaerolineales bacterium]HNO30181.1 PAS domain S-box protein [Anaerolineales bacterium]
MKPARILIVEDDAILATHLEETVSRMGYQVTGLAATGQDAVRSALEDTPDVILMDIRLRDDMNGIQAANEIHQKADTPVVYLTAYTDDSLLQQAKVTDAYAYLTKPVREQELRASLEMALYKYASERNIQHLNQVLRAVRDVNQLITRERDPQRLLDQACTILMQTRGYQFVWVGQSAKDRLKMISSAGNGIEFFNSVFATATPEQGQRLPGTVCFRTKQPVVCADILHDERYGPWVEKAREAQFLSTASIPMLNNGNLFGVLTVYANQIDIFGEEEISLLVELAGDIAFGLKSIEEENERRLAQTSRLAAEEEYRKIFENAPVGIFQSLPEDGAFLNVNPAMASIYGYNSPQDLLESVHDIAAQIYAYPEQRESFKKLLTEQNEVYQFQAVNKRKDGSLFWTSTNARAIRNPQGEILYYEGFVQDVTETKQAEEALREREEMFSALISNTGDLILLVDAQGIIRFASPSLPRMLGYEVEEAVGRNYLGWAHPDDLKALLQAFADRSKAAGVAPNSTIARVRHRDGSWRIMEGLGTNLLDDPAIQGFIINIRDVTERELDKQELLDREAKYRSVIETSPDGFWVVDMEGRILEANDAYLRLSGYAREEITNINITDVEAVESPAETRIHIERLVREGSDLFETMHRAKDGEIYPIEISVSYSKAQGGRIYAFLREISGRKQAEREIRLRTEDLLLINALNNAANHDQGIEEITGIFTSGVRRMFSGEDTALYLLSPDGKFLEMKANTVTTKLMEHIERMIGGSIPSIRIPLDTSPILRKLLENEKGTLTTDRQEITQMVMEFTNTAFLPGALAATIRKIVPQIAKLLNHKSVISVPLVSNGRTLGMIDISSKGDLTEEHLTRVRNVAQQMTAILLRRQAEVNVKVQLQRITALSEIDRAISSSLDLHLSLEVLLNEVLTQLDVDAASILLLNMDSQTLEYVAGKGFHSMSLRYAQIRVGDPLAGMVGLERRMIHIPNLREMESQIKRIELLKEDEFVEYFGTPLIAKGTLKGVLEIFHRKPLNINMDWINYLETLGGQAAIAIDNAQLFEGMQQSNQDLITAYDATITGWSHAMDLRDKETEGHTQRVTELTIRLAERMGIPQTEMLHLRRGALLHDIGKLGVPDHILLKPGKLTDDEWEVMHQHPTYALNMLLPITYLRAALDIPYCHHEKWDGSGYPRGLKGDQIPFVARIFAIVDVWDALRSDRPYRPKWDLEKVRAHLREQSGTHFDPQVVEAFLRMLDETPEIF